MLTLALTLAAGAAAVAQTAPPPAPAAPSATPSGCEARNAGVAGIGRASTFAFTGTIFGDRICATVANLALGAFTAQLAGAPATGALVVATVGNGSNATLAVQGPGDLTVVPSDTAPAGAVASAAVGPFVIAPGGTIPSFGGDTSSLPRVVLAFAGARLLVIGTTPAALADLARELRDQPDLFGVDAVERAVVLASGPNASVTINADGGQLGPATVASSRLLVLTKR
jgi:hypothetical protein